jgi:hypothetical protein
MLHSQPMRQLCAIIIPYLQVAHLTWSHSKWGRKFSGQLLHAHNERVKAREVGALQLLFNGCSLSFRSTAGSIVTGVKPYYQRLHKQQHKQVTTWLSSLMPSAVQKTHTCVMPLQQHEFDHSHSDNFEHLQ